MELYDEIELSHELDRKSLEALDWLTSNEKYMTNETRNVAITVFQMTTRGLIDPEVSQEVDNHWIDKAKSAISRVASYFNSEKQRFYCVRLDVSECKVITDIHSIDRQISKRADEFDTPEETYRHWIIVRSLLESKGYKDITV